MRLFILALAAALPLAACSAKIEGTAPARVIETRSCQPACVNALALSDDGTRVAVSSQSEIEIFDATTGDSRMILDGGADALAATGSASPPRLLAQSKGEGGLRVMRFDTGAPTYATKGSRTPIIENPRFDAFRDNGAALETFQDADYHSVRLLDPRHRQEVPYGLGGGRDDHIELLSLSAVSESLNGAAFTRPTADDKGRTLVLSHDHFARWAENAFDRAPDHRTFSRDGRTFAADLDGRAAVWAMKDVKITDRFEPEQDGKCLVAGRASPTPDKLSVICAGTDGVLTVWRAPGRVEVGRAAPEAGWTLKDWRLSRDGRRLALLETGAAAAGGTPVRLRLIALDPAGPGKTLDLGHVDKVSDLVFAIDGTGKTVAVRRPDGRLAIYAGG